MLKFLFFIFIFITLVRFISNRFLPGKKRGTFSFFYKTFRNVREQQKQQNQKKAESGNVKNRLDEIEEAEYEDVTDDKSG